MFFNRKKKEKKDRLRTEKLAIGQAAMLTAAMEANVAAQEVTLDLKKELEQSNKKFETTSKVLNDGLILCSMDGDIQHANRSARKMFGDNLNEGRNILEIFRRSEPIESITDLWTYLKDDSYSNPGSVDPLKGLKNTGDTFWINPKLEKIDWHDQRSSMVVVINDNLSPSIVENYSSIFNETNDSIVICQNQKIMAANHNFEVLFGHASKDIVNQDITALLNISSLEKKLNSQTTIFDDKNKPVRVCYNVIDFIWNGKPASIVIIFKTQELLSVSDKLATNIQKHDLVVVFNRSFKIITANQLFFDTFEQPISASQDAREIFSDEVSRTYFSNIFNKDDQRILRIQTVNFNRVYDWIDYIIYDINGIPLEVHRVGRSLTDILEKLAVPN